MFLRTLKAPVIDPIGVKKEWERWHDELALRTGGWLGSVAGITAADEFIAVQRYEFEAMARIASRKPEHKEWEVELARYLDGPLKVHDSKEADLIVVGGAGARFVQIIQGRTDDIVQMRAVNYAWEDLLLRHRPDILGSHIGWDDDGSFTKVACFVSEESARAWEGREYPGGLAALFEDLMGLIEDIQFHDITEPWMHEPESE